MILRIVLIIKVQLLLNLHYTHVNFRIDILP